MLNTGNMKILGLKRCSSATKDFKGYYSGEYIELFYNVSTGEAWPCYHYSIGQNEWMKYDDPNIIKIANYSIPTTMKQMADDILRTLDQMKRTEG